MTSSSGANVTYERLLRLVVCFWLTLKVMWTPRSDYWERIHTDTRNAMICSILGGGGTRQRFVERQQQHAFQSTAPTWRGRQTSTGVESTGRSSSEHDSTECLTSPTSTNPVSGRLASSSRSIYICGFIYLFFLEIFNGEQAFYHYTIHIANSY